MENQIKIFYSKEWPASTNASLGGLDYELLDTGEGEKLERFGKYIFVRPYEDAVWKKTLSKKEWDKIDGKFWSTKEGAQEKRARLASASDASRGGWKMNTKLDARWEMSYKDIKFFVSPTPFRHMGFFPEQASQWDFIENRIREVRGKIKFLNLFGYTGVASLFALRAGAEVTHLDASRQILTWAKDNQKLSKLDNLPMRIICDDSIKFLEREAKRGNKYDCVIMDPPKFGRGPKGEIWKIEEMLPALLSSVAKILSDKPLFVILTSYATDSSALSLGYALKDMMKDFSGNVETGELCVLENSNNRFISLANTAIWSPLIK
jgi:23S rRNA (cytosine1962-C5)-methyltransferase